MKVSVYATHNSVQEKEIKGKVVIVVDVLRATSSILTALSNDCKEIIPMVEIEEAMNIANNYERDTFLLGGERNTQKIEGFHLSNSPSEYSREVVEGRTIMITTTNGTRAIRKAVDAKLILMAAFMNVEAITDYILTLDEDEDIIFICAGTDGKFTLEDILAAGAVLERLEAKGAHIQLDDLALVSKCMYEQHKDNLHGVLKSTYHYSRLVEAGLKADIDDCLKMDTAPIVPVCKDGVIRKMENF